MKDTVLFVFVALVAITTIAGMWGTFEKAGKPGWGVIVPVYNIYLMLKIAGRPGWWMLLLLVPVVSVIFTFVIAFDTAKSFGYGLGFALGLIFLPFIFYPILGFGSATYTEPAV